MSDPRTTAIEYAHRNHARFLAELVDFGSIPSISTAPEAKPDVQRATQ